MMFHEWISACTDCLLPFSNISVDMGIIFGRLLLFKTLYDGVGSDRLFIFCRCLFYDFSWVSACMCWTKVSQSRSCTWWAFFVTFEVFEYYSRVGSDTLFFLDVCFSVWFFMGEHFCMYWLPTAYLETIYGWRFFWTFSIVRHGIAMLDRTGFFFSLSLSLVYLIFHEWIFVCSDCLLPISSL